MHRKTVTEEEKNQCRDYKVNDVGDENHMTIEQGKQSRSKRKKKRIIISYFIVQHHGIKRTNMCWRDISL